MSANLRAFLAVIRHCEGTAGPDGYRTLFGGELFDSFADHPRRQITRALKGRPITSTAAGAYQFLARTWDECRRALNLPDFSPESQDLAAVFLIRRRGALADVEAGRIEAALRKCNREWASLPGAPYGQPTKPLAECLAVYHRAGGAFVPSPAQPEAPMAPFVAAALPALLQAAPALIRIFGDGAQSEKNAKAAEMVASIAKEATGAPTIEQATEAIQTNPDAAAAFREGVQTRWFELTEAGGGGIAGAREAAAKAQGDRPAWFNPALWITAALLPLVYGVVFAVVFGDAATFSDEIRVMVVTAVVSGTLGGIIAYWLGSSMSSRNKDELIARR